MQNSLAGLSRRRDVRLEPSRRLAVSVAGLSGTLELKDISTSGLCLIARTPFALRSTHVVTLSIGRVRTDVAAKTVHCRRHASGGWIMGLELLPATSRQPFTVEDVVNELLMTQIQFY